MHLFCLKKCMIIADSQLTESFLCCQMLAQASPNLPLIPSCTDWWFHLAKIRKNLVFQLLCQWTYHLAGMLRMETLSAQGCGLTCWSVSLSLLCTANCFDISCTKLAILKDVNLSLGFANWLVVLKAVSHFLGPFLNTLSNRLAQVDVFICRYP